MFNSEILNLILGSHSKMYFYQAYGLGILSAIQLSELKEVAQTKADVVIEFGQVNRSLMQVNHLGTYLHVTPQEVSFFWNEVGAFSVSNGREIIIDPLPDVEDRLLRLPLYGVVFATLMHQRGLLTLHASAVEIQGGAAVFLGGRGWGKSTLSATLYGRGHHFVSDDLVVVDVKSTRCPMVIPGVPQIKLMPEAAAQALGDDPQTLPRLAIGYEKRSRLASDRFCQQPLPLKGIYELAKGPEPKIKLLSPQKGFIQLLANAYIARSVNQLLQGVGGSHHLQQCTNLVNQVSIHRLERPQSLELVPTLAALVETHLTQPTHLTLV